jgi:hypothetical protein
MVIRELRRRPRLVARLPVEYRTSRSAGLGRTLDVGVGGAFVHVLDEIPLGAWIELGFVLRGRKSPPSVRCLGRVLRLQDRGGQEAGMHGIAVQFHQFIEGEEELRAYLARQLELPPEQIGDVDRAEVPPEELAAIEAVPRPDTPGAAASEPAASATADELIPELEEELPDVKWTPIMHDVRDAVLADRQPAPRKSWLRRLLGG